MSDYAGALADFGIQLAEEEAFDRLAKGPFCYGIACLCGSRRTARSAEGLRRRDCLDCGRSFVWRVQNGLIVPFAPETAKVLDEAQIRKALTAPQLWQDSGAGSLRDDGRVKEVLP